MLLEFILQFVFKVLIGKLYRLKKVGMELFEEVSLFKEDYSLLADLISFKLALGTDIDKYGVV